MHPHSITHTIQSPVIDLCNICATENIVFPSLEAFEEGINLPLLYMIFYDYFFRSSVGDTAWKKSILETEDPTEPLAPEQGEAFAMLLLRNNYFAWLWEAKSQYKDLLVTEYDTRKEREQKFEDLGYHFLNCQIDLEADEDEDDITKIVLYGTKADTIARHDSLLGKYGRELKKIWQAASKNKKYKEFKKALGKATESDDDQNTSDVEEDEQEGEKENESTRQGEQHASVFMEQRTKKRKILKSFREYTNSNDEEGKFKGWSTRAGEDLSILTHKLMVVTSKEKVFRRAYRHIYKQKIVASSKKKKANKEPKPVNYQTKIWNLEVIESVEI